MQVSDLETSICSCSSSSSEIFICNRRESDIGSWVYGVGRHSRLDKKEIKGAISLRDSYDGREAFCTPSL